MPYPLYNPHGDTSWEASWDYYIDTNFDEYMDEFDIFIYNMQHQNITLNLKDIKAWINKMSSWFRSEQVNARVMRTLFEKSTKNKQIVHFLHSEDTFSVNTAATFLYTENDDFEIIRDKRIISPFRISSVLDFSKLFFNKEKEHIYLLKYILTPEYIEQYKLELTRFKDSPSIQTRANDDYLQTIHASILYKHVLDEILTAKDKKMDAVLSMLILSKSIHLSGLHTNDDDYMHTIFNYAENELKKLDSNLYTQYKTYDLLGSVPDFASLNAVIPENNLELPTL